MLPRDCHDVDKECRPSNSMIGSTDRQIVYLLLLQPLLLLAMLGVMMMPTTPTLGFMILYLCLSCQVTPPSSSTSSSSTRILLVHRHLMLHFPFIWFEWLPSNSRIAPVACSPVACSPVARSPIACIVIINFYTMLIGSKVFPYSIFYALCRNLHAVQPGASEPCAVFPGHLHT